MNKGIKKAHGAWLLFLNAGDSFYSNHSVAELVSNISPKVSFIYGDANYIENDEQYIVKHKPIKTIVKSIPFCHQAILCNAEITRKYHYNEKYKICADYDMFLRAFLNGEKFRAIDSVICNYIVGGYSKQNQIKLFW